MEGFLLAACLGFCVTLEAVLPGLPCLPKYSVVAMQGTYFGIQKMLSAAAWGAGGLRKAEESTHLWGGAPWHIQQVWVPRALCKQCTHQESSQSQLLPPGLPSPPWSLLPASHMLTVWIHPRGAGSAGAQKGCPWVRVGSAGAAEAEVNSTAANYSLHRAIKGVLFIKNTETRALRWELARAGAERPQGRRVLGAAVGARVPVQCPAPCWETSWVSEVLSWNLASKGSARVCLNPADVCRRRAKLHLAASHRAVCRKPPPSSLLCRAGCRGCRRLFPPYSGLLFVLCPR